MNMLTVGQILKKAREDKNLSLDDIYRKTRIRTRILKNIEEENWNEFSSKIYIIGILRKYSAALDLDNDRILAFFRRDYERDEKLKFKERISKEYFAPTTKKIVSTIVLLSLGGVIFYFLFQLFAFVSPPYLKIIKPRTWTINKSKFVEIVGKVKPDSQVSIEGEIIEVNDRGFFRYKLPVNSSLKEVVIKVVGANGKTTVFRKRLLKQRN